MKTSKLAKIVMILVIIAIGLISFGGVFVSSKGQMKNILPEYELGMNVKGSRLAKFKVSDKTQEIIYDEQGNVTTEGTNEDGSLKEGYTKENKAINEQTILTEENYNIVKKIMESRLDNMGIGQYVIRLNHTNGEILVEFPENSDTDNAISKLTYLGKFEIKDSQTNEILMDNKDIKHASSVYGSTNTGTVVYLSIEFNKEGKQKLEEITKTYITSSDEQGNSNTKNIRIELDGESMIETYFEEVITTGILQLSIGSASNSNKDISEYIKQANQLAGVIDSGVMPITYELEENNYVSAQLENGSVNVIIVVISALLVIGFINWIIRYKANGIRAVISYIGLIAVILLVIRYTNVEISLEAIVSAISILVANYLVLQYVLNEFTKAQFSKNEIIQKTYKRYASILCPLFIISIVFTFINWLPIASIGMVLFWGMTILMIYDYISIQILLEPQNMEK